VNGESLLETLANAGLDPDAAPGSRVGKNDFSAYESHLLSLMGKLRPLPVAREPDVQADDEADIVVIGRLGEGGMGVVELARQPTLGRNVALKRLKPSLAHERQALALLDEARIHGSLEHPNIVPVHAIGLDPTAGPVVILKRVQGDAWSDALVEDRAALPGDPTVLEKHLRMLMQVCNALHYAHARGVFHRDVKPSNVMLGEYGEVYLLDWGLALDEASSAREASVAGTPPYMAPEMVGGEPSDVDARTDVYLLGATLHEVLTGTTRNRGETLMSCLTKAAISEPVSYPKEVPLLLGEICNRACARDKADRFPTALALRNALADFLDLREAQMLVDAAEQLLSADVEETDEHAGTRRLDEARFACEQALRARPGMHAAERMRERCLIASLRHELDQNNLRGAEALSAQLGDRVPDELRNRLVAKQRGVASERARVEQLDRDYDPEVSRADRLRFALVAVVVLSLLVGLEYWMVPGGEDTGLFALFGLAWGVLALPPLYQARVKMWDTAMGRQFVWIMIAASSAVLIGRLIAWLGNAPPHLMFAQEVALLAMLPLAVDSPLRGRVLGALIGMALALACAALPDLSHHLHTAWLLFILLVLVVDNALPHKKTS